MAEIAPAPANPSSSSLPSPLRRLPGTSTTVRFSRAVPRAKLWLDDANLVQESLRSYTQEVQRFALADIQAIQFRGTPRGLIYSAILLALLAPPLLGLLMDNSRTSTAGYRYFLMATIVFFAVLLVINLARGQTCRTTLTTALGPQLLPSLSRVGPTRRAILLIAASIATVQGDLRPDEAALEVDRARTTRPPVPAPAPAAPSPAPTSAAPFKDYRY